VNGKAGSPVRNQNTTAQSIAVDDPKVVASDRLASHSAERNRSMIRCIPRGICSWNFVLDGAGHQGILELGWMGEQGAITVDGIPFDIQKHGMFSGRWTLNHEGQEVASAQKSTAFTRTFEIQDPSGELVLRAESALGRSFRLERSDDVIATVRPDHAFTRRASIEILTKQWDLPTVYFSFWLVALMWRRAAQSNNG
jgi:hypothetical protein